MKKQLIILAVIATIIFALTGCATAKARFYHDGKAIVKVLGPVVVKLGEDFVLQELKEISEHR